MSEVDEVAQSIIEAHPAYFPAISRQHVVSIVTGQMPEESQAMISAVTDAILELKPCQK
jgi:hypothetical protein